MKLETVFLLEPVFKLPNPKKDIFIENNTVSEEHQIQEKGTACTENVSRFDYFLPKLKIYLRNKIKAFKGGCISSRIEE